MTVSKISSNDRVYSELRARINRGDIRPNERLVESRIASELGVSRTPVREALNRLAAEDLVTGRSGYGFTVREHQLADILQIYEVRAAVESHLAYLAAQRATPEERAALVDKVGDTTISGDLLLRESRVQRNLDFHSIITSAARSPMLSKVLLDNNSYYFNARIAAFHAPADIVGFHTAHRDIARLIHDADADRAAQAMRDHISHAARLIAERWC